MSLRVMNINTTSFKGQYVSNSNEENLKNNPLWHKNSSSEKTLDSYHSNPTGKTYFAEPLENVPDSIKEKVDYVVYDNEPAYPNVNEEVSKNYFGEERKNYRKDFEEIRDYYYRREMGGFANVEEAKYQQWQAAECIRLYDNAGDIRFKKETAEDEIKTLESDSKAIQEGISITEKSVEIQKSLKSKLEKHIKSLSKLQDSFSKINRTLDDGIENEVDMQNFAKDEMNNVRGNDECIAEMENSAYYNEGIEEFPFNTSKYGEKYANASENIKDVEKASSNKFFSIAKVYSNAKKEYAKLEGTIAYYKGINDKCADTISKMQDYIATLQAKMAENAKNIESKTSFIENCKKQLIPLFDELKNFYAKQGIKTIR